MKTLNVASVRNSFSRLVDEIHESGEGVIVSKYGRPFIMLVPVVQSSTKHAGNSSKGTPSRKMEGMAYPPKTLRTLQLAMDTLPVPNDFDWRVCRDDALLERFGNG